MDFRFLGPEPVPRSDFSLPPGVFLAVLREIIVGNVFEAAGDAPDEKGNGEPEDRPGDKYEQDEKPDSGLEKCHNLRH